MKAWSRAGPCTINGLCSTLKRPQAIPGWRLIRCAEVGVTTSSGTWSGCILGVMAELVTKIRIFIGSPGDVAAERHALTQTINDLNVGFASSRKMVLELAKWETHVWPGFGEDAQGVIN